LVSISPLFFPFADNTRFSPLLPFFFFIHPLRRVYDEGDDGGLAEAKSVHMDRERQLVLCVDVDLKNRELVDRPTCAHFVERILAIYAERGMAWEAGSFVDIGSGRGNVVSYISVAHPLAFTYIHALDVFVSGDDVSEITEMQHRAFPFREISWWNVASPANASATRWGLADGPSSPVSDVLSGAAIVYSSDAVFRTETVIRYREYLARALLAESSRGKNMLYVSYHPVSSSSRRAQMDVWQTSRISDPHLSPFARSWMMTKVVSGTDVAWGSRGASTSVYLVVLGRD